MSEYKIIRSNLAGVFLAKIEKQVGQNLVLRDARRLWQWSGANSVSDLAVNGVSRPESCRFAVPVDRIEIFEVVEILDATEKAVRSIKEVPLWTAH